MSPHTGTKCPDVPSLAPIWLYNNDFLKDTNTLFSHLRLRRLAPCMLLIPARKTIEVHSTNDQHAKYGTADLLHGSCHDLSVCARHAGRERRLPSEVRSGA